MCDFPESRMAAECLLGCGVGVARHSGVTRPRAGFRAYEWSVSSNTQAFYEQPCNSHILGVVDMDLYGAFQICSIGILAAPLTVRLSRTYFYDPGRNIIFLWTVLILCGLVALCVEFYRVTPTDCKTDNFNHTISSAATFPYGGNATCGLLCSETDGPFSVLRGGAAANVNVIPVPRILTFNALMLLSAGFCIPAILSLIFTWDKILEINWKRQREDERLNERIEGANITVGEMRGINKVVRLFLSVVEIPLFGGVILTIIGIGEANFFSPQVNYDTEPMGSIGKWNAPHKITTANHIQGNGAHSLERS